MITTRKWQILKQRMDALGIHESDLVEKFVLGSGHGGQKVNKTASCVFLQHTPTGIKIKCQQSRMRADNRYHARVRLCDKVEEEILQEKSKQQQLYEKIRRQKKRRTRRGQARVRAEKEARSVIKKQRQKPSEKD